MLNQLSHQTPLCQELLLNIVFSDGVKELKKKKYSSIISGLSYKRLPSFCKFSSGILMVAMHR